MKNFIAKVKERFKDPLKLQTSGATLLTNKTRTTLAVATILLIGQLFIDLWAWSTAWYYFLPGESLIPLALGSVFAFSILVFDRMIITADISGSNKSSYLSLAGRFLIIVVLALVTAIPVELRVLESEIEGSFNKREAANVKKILDKAVEKEEKVFDDMITKENKVLPPEVKKIQDKWSKDIDKFLKKRKAERKALIAQQEKQEASLIKLHERSKKRMIDELVGKKISTNGITTGITGAGPVYKALKDQELEAAGRVTEFQNKAAADIQIFDQETQTQLQQLQSARDKEIERVKDKSKKAVAKMEADKLAKVMVTRLLSPDQLSKLYGGKWRVSRGFFDRFNELGTLADNNAKIVFIIWACRIIMMAIAFLILMFKVMCPVEMKEYYSFSSQLAAGEPDTMMVAKGMGYNVDDEDARYRAGITRLKPDEIRKLRQELLQIQTELAAVYQRFLEESYRLASIPFSDGLFHSHEEIERELRSYWASHITPLILRVNELDAQLDAFGLSSDEWNEELGIDPREVERNQEPWRVTKKELKTWGWEDPKVILDKAETALTALSRQRMEIERFLLKMNDPLATLISQNPSIPRVQLRDLEPFRYQTYKDQILPRIWGMDYNKKLILAAAMSVPKWVPETHFALDDMERCWHIPSPEELTKWYGWRDAECERLVKEISVYSGIDKDKVRKGINRRLDKGESWEDIKDSLAKLKKEPVWKRPLVSWTGGEEGKGIKVIDHRAYRQTPGGFLLPPETVPSVDSRQVNTWIGEDDNKDNDGDKGEGGDTTNTSQTVVTNNSKKSDDNSKPAQPDQKDFGPLVDEAKKTAGTTWFQAPSVSDTSSSMKKAANIKWWEYLLWPFSSAKRMEMRERRL